MATTLSDAPKKSNQTDDFLSGVQSFFDALFKNPRALSALAVVIAVAIAAGAFTMSKRETQSEAGRNALFLAQQSLNQQLKAIAQAEAPAAPAAPTKKDAKAEKTPEITADSVMFKKFDTDAKLGDSVAKLKSVSEQYPGTRAAFDAETELGNLYFDHGDAAKALPWFQKSVGSSITTMDRALALDAVGYTQENLGQLKDAMDTFQKSAALNDPTSRGDALLSTARIQQKMGDSAKAKATYDQVISQLPSTEYAHTAEQLKGQLE